MNRPFFCSCSHESYNSQLITELFFLLTSEAANYIMYEVLMAIFRRFLKQTAYLLPTGGGNAQARCSGIAGSGTSGILVRPRVR
jgi:hypothetical protein